MRLPSISSVEAFDAAARHMNFTKAGKELNLTSSAISQRISALEDDLGFSLFCRHGPKLLLSEEGRLCRPVLRQALMNYRETMGSVQTLTQRRMLTLKVSPSFSEKWLAPRLARFDAMSSKIDLRIWSANRPMDQGEDSLCVTIAYGIDPHSGVPENHIAELLLTEQVFPVCAPKYMAGFNETAVLSNLSKMKLLHDDNMEPMRSFPNWRRWCACFKLEGVNTGKGSRFTVSSMAINAAVEGHGVALARSALVEKDLEAGRLIRPFKEIFPLEFHYYLVHPRLLADRQDFNALRSWLLSEVEAVTSKKS